jgi:hypothetical protein
LVYEAYPLICEDKTFYIDKICEETGLLNEVTPVELKIIIRNAMFEFDKMHYSTQSLSPIESGNFNSISIANKKTIEKEKATTINFNNSKLQKTWLADTTEISFLSFERKKNLFGGNDDFNIGGFEYYVDGIFSFPDFDTNTAERSQSKTTYVTSFDWRNRHGKNWMTSVKNQWPCNSCCVFSAIGATEAMFNIYYNNADIDLDLSEQHISSCCTTGCGNCTYGCAYISNALNFIRNNGVVKEGCFPFETSTTPCDSICSNPDEIIYINATNSVSNTVENLKSALINIGPLSSAVSTLGHAMPLLGYNQIVEGDTICFPKSGGCSDSVIQAGSPYIGLTYWIFKNSYGSPGNHGHDGYLYVFFQSISSISQANTAEAPYSTLTYTRNCTDADNDGYYWWGTGTKPSTCPDCAPDIADCDDSDPLIGPIDEYGNCTVITEPYEADHVINTTVTWSNTSICGDVYVISGGNLTIDNTDVNIYNEFSVEIGGTLTITEGEIK